MLSPTYSEFSRADDQESIITSDSSITAISGRYLSTNLNATNRPDIRSTPQRFIACKPQFNAHSPASVRPGAVVGNRRFVHDTTASIGTNIGSEFLNVFPMPNPRRAGGLRDLRLPKSLSSDHLEEDHMEAAWEDASCIDGNSPRVGAEAFEVAETMEDRFEVDALKRQVEQLQMALQMQGEQLALVESQQGHHGVRARPSQNASRSRGEYDDEEPYAYLAKGQAAAKPHRSVQRTQALRSSTVYPAQPPPPAAAKTLPPLHYPHTSSHSTDSRLHQQQQHSYALTADSLLHNLTADSLAPQSYRLAHTSELQPHPYTDSMDRQRLHHSPAATVADSDKLEDIDRKLAVLEQLIEALNVQSHAPPAPPHPAQKLPPRGTNTSISIPPQNDATPRAKQCTLPAESTLLSPVSAQIGTTSRTGKLASVLGLKKSPSMNASQSSASASSLSVNSLDSAAPKEGTTARVSWSRKRTEKVTQPKVKVRQGPGRGRMVIRETSS